MISWTLGVVNELGGIRYPIKLLKITWVCPFPKCILSRIQ
jgi:hypothetical protein